ncbi:hypothetical protein QWZ08_05275 [Ferruginibacter paludis]|uniref:hypothetical protein n=1 Tax=Ferruginibacter paludis TaxID=1310417 RepID=UPI0025B54D72|nr:hypothetical protein [Ferruginibacter paludis]MDN3655024.1 hypothetical protein [Ferruginibacter paludis]
MNTKNRDVYILSCIAIVIFIFYWVAIFILAMPVTRASEIISHRSPFFTNTFGVSWTLFTPPSTFNDRLYFIVRNGTNHGLADTIEVLENIALQKQRRAPFNQKENVIDHLVNNNVWNLKKHVWLNKKKPSQILSSCADSLYIASAIAAIINKRAYTANLNTLTNYARMVLQQHKIDRNGKEIKILITEKQIRPFGQMDDNNFKPTEIVVFETPFNMLAN